MNQANEWKQYLNVFADGIVESVQHSLADQHEQLVKVRILQTRIQSLQVGIKVRDQTIHIKRAVAHFQLRIEDFADFRLDLFEHSLTLVDRQVNGDVYPSCDAVIYFFKFRVDIVDGVGEYFVKLIHLTGSRIIVLQFLHIRAVTRYQPIG